jgi:ATP-dependent Clp protease ATP-binding subunit ClpX
MNDTKDKLPDQKELEKELNDYLSKKYGDRIKLGVSMLVPKGALDESDSGGETPKQISKVQFDLKPEELEAFLDEFVIKQQAAKEVLSTKVCTHFNRIRYSEETDLQDRLDGVGQIKNNIIMVGPTGVGKTYIIKLIAKKLGVPFVKGDATKFSETGYVGGDVEDLVRDLVHEADGDVQLAEHGIIYVDEIDKIASSGTHIGPDVSRAGVQRALLKPMEETEVDMKVPHDPISLMEAIEQYRKTGKKERKKVNTRNILFIMSGAFNGLDDIIKKRLRAQGMGFGADIQSREESYEYLRYLKAEDLIGYGFESEFVGRLPVIVIFDVLEVDDLYEILRNPNSPVIQGKKRDFKAYGIHVVFEDAALRLLAEKAFHEQTGARGLVSVVERALIRFEKRLPSTQVRRLVVTEELVRDPDEALPQLLNDPDSADMEARYARCVEEERQVIRAMIERKMERYENRYGEALTDRRLELVIDYVMKRGADLQKAFEEMVKIYKTIRYHEKRFFERFAMRITFDDGAINRIVERVFVEGANLRRLMEDLCENYEHGLRLIQEKIGQDEFILTREAVDSPEDYLNRLIREYYS